MWQDSEGKLTQSDEGELEFQDHAIQGACDYGLA